METQITYICGYELNDLTLKRKLLFIKEAITPYALQKH